MQAIPGTFSFSATSSKTEIRYAEINSFTVELNVPTSAATPLKATIHANPRSRVYTITNIRVDHSGSNIGTGPLSAIPTEISSQNDQFIDSFTIDFGDVTNTGASALDPSENSIVIKFDTVTRNSSELFEGYAYPVQFFVEYGSQYNAMRERRVTFTPSDWATFVSPVVEVTQASANIFPGAVVGWTVQIKNLTDAGNFLQVGAYVPSSVQGDAIKITNIFRIGAGTGFSWFSNDFGNVRNNEGATLLLTPWMEIVNKSKSHNQTTIQQHSKSFLFLRFLGYCKSC